MGGLGLFAAKNFDATSWHDDGNPLGFDPDLSMRGVGDNSIGGDDVHGPTIAFQWMLRLSNRYTTSYGCRDLVGVRHPATRAPVLQAIKN